MSGDFEQDLRALMLRDTNSLAQLNVRTPVTYHAAIDMVAERLNVSKSEILRNCLKIGLEAYLMAATGDSHIFIRGGTSKRQHPILVR